MGEVTVLTDADFESFTNQDGVVLVDFWAPWCGPCKRIAPIIDELSDEMGEVKFAKINTDENQQTAIAQGVMSIPTLMVYKDGQKVDTVIGAVPKDNLASTLKRHV